MTPQTKNPSTRRRNRAVGLQPAAAHDPANGVQACSQYRCYQSVIAYPPVVTGHRLITAIACCLAMELIIRGNRSPIDNSQFLLPLVFNAKSAA
jgi:hypothetical protein